MATKEFVALDGLTRYDQLLKGVMSTEDAKAIKVVTVSNNIVNFYKTETATGTPAYTVSLPTVSDFIHKISSATGGKIVTSTSGGEVAESSTAISDLATKAFVGTLPAGAESTNVIDYIDEVIGNTIPENLVTGYFADPSAGQLVIYNDDQSMGTIATVSINANDVVTSHLPQDGYLAVWEDGNVLTHGWAATSMMSKIAQAAGGKIAVTDSSGNVNESNTAISDLATKVFVGSIPSGSSASTVVGYVDEQVNDLENSLGTAAFKDVPTSGNASTSQVVMGNDTRLSDARQASDVSAWAKASTKPTYTASEVGAIATTAKGVANGVAELDSTGRVPSSQLPSYVDDVIDGYYYNNKFYEDSAHTTEITGQTGKIYIDLVSNKTYRWTGSGYAEISASLALGETSSTAYRGDRGKTAYDHSQLTSGNPHNVTKSDVGLGNVGNFKAVSTAASQGLTSTEQANARTNIGLGTAAVKDVPASGNASTTQVVMGNDTRVTDEPNLRAAFDALGFSVVNGALCQTYTA